MSSIAADALATQQAAILGAPDGFEMVDFFAAPDAREHLVLFTHRSGGMMSLMCFPTASSEL